MSKEDSVVMEKEIEEHYIGNDIPVRFDVFLDGERVTPLSADADVYDPKSQYVATGPAKVSKGEVLYLLESYQVKSIGIYTIIINVKLRYMGEQSHVVKVKVVKLPIKGRKV